MRRICWPSACALGWVLGILLLRGRPRILALTGAASGLSFFMYACAYMYSAGHWWLPIPIYIEHTLFPLFWTAAIAGYLGALQALAARARRWLYPPAGEDAGVVSWRRRMRSLSPAQAVAATAIVAAMAASV